MGLIAKEQRFEIAGLTWTFGRPTMEQREQCLALEEEHEFLPACYRKIAACVLRVEGDDEGQSVSWPSDEAGRLDLLSALTLSDFMALNKFLADEVLGLRVEKQGNSDGQPSPLPGQE